MSVKGKPIVGFVILTWNSENVIQNCLESIFEMEEILARVVVVDNGSSDTTFDLIHTYRENKSWNDRNTCATLRLDKNYGTTISRNKGLEYLLSTYPDTEFICILDSDTEVNEKSCLKMIRELCDHQKYGIIGPRMHDSNMVYQVSGRNIPTLSEKLLKVMPIKKLSRLGEKMQGMIPEEGSGCVQVGYLMSACWLMRTAVVREIGLLDERIFYAPEDVDYCIRCWKKGYQVIYCYDADILHHWQRLSRKKLLSKHNYEHIKGLVYLFRKHRYLFRSKQFCSYISGD